MTTSYNDFLNILKTGLSTLPDVIYTEIQLEDMIELNPQSYPSQTGLSCWICPIPMTINDINSITYNARVYVTAQIKEDSSDRFSMMSLCITRTMNMLQQFSDAYNGVVYPLNLTPVLLFDSQSDGVFTDVSMTFNVTC